MACKIEHASVEYRNPETGADSICENWFFFLKTDLKLYGKPFRGKVGGGRDTMMQFFPIEFLSPRIFSAETTIHRSALPLPSPQQESTP